MKREPRDDRPKYYECGGCDCWHRVEFMGDCRADNERFHMDELDEKHGGYQGWIAADDPLFVRREK